MRVLFLADRRELVRQALGDFKEHMPNETRARIEGGEVDDTARPTEPLPVGLFRLRLRKAALLGKTSLTMADLQRHPLNREGDPRRFFDKQQLAEILDFANRLAA